MTSLSPLKKHRFAVLAAPSLKVVECVCELIVPFLVKTIIDEGLSEDGSRYGDVGYIVSIALIVLALSVLGFLATMVTQYVASRVSTDYGYELRREVYRQFGSLSSSQINDYGRSKALNLLSSDSFSLQNGVFMFMRLLVRAPFLTIGSIVMSFVLNVYAGIAVLSALLLCALTVAIVMAKTPKGYVAVQSGLDELTSLGEDGVMGARVIRTFNLQEKSKAEFAAKSEEYKRRSDSLSLVNAIVNPLTFGLVNLAIVAVFYLGSYQFSFSGLSSGSIVAIVSLLTQALTALIQFSRLVTSLSKAFASKRRLDGFLALENCLKDGERDLPEVQQGETLIEAKGVSLSYGGESNAVDRVDFLLRKGERIGILGGTGSGKSSLLSLLLRFNDPSEGELCFGGIPYAELNSDDIRAQIAIVFQKPQIFEGTVYSNVALSDPEMGEERVNWALEQALCTEFASSYEDGMSHHIEEGGSNLSGGQRQRILIARALASRRSILILDDSTSALDYKSDLLIRQNIAAIKGISTIIVSQRATSIKDCDRIYVFDKGAIVGVGTNEELLESCPIYRETLQAQVDQR
ncbi:MAG: ABC transporter ATP-binding protein [Firmicutes bacterium]|uniref:ABC transporter ATP-binding protein n=1 Tax=Candidatus Alloenteromonas pullistercoris TaxID=2840785 RepID=A0A9D9DFN6_9FIRM|nr:ABC transporter ATP-binding protein [Candidatus Enteromonas pullistercoris]